MQQSKKIADAKLAKDFEAALKEFQKAQHITVERETSYIPFDPKGSFSSRYEKPSYGYFISRDNHYVLCYMIAILVWLETNWFKHISC